MKNRKSAAWKAKSRRDDRSRDRNFRIRLFLVTAFFALLGSAVIGKAVYIQIFQHTSLTEKAVSQYQKSVYLSPSRGVIYDREGRELAANVEAFSVYAEPPIVGDRKKTAARLSRILEIPHERVYRSLAAGKGFSWIKRQINPKEARAIKELDLKGIGLLTESRRFYPHRELASQLIGFAGVDSQGLEGVEFSYDSYLRGNAGWLVVQRDALDRSIFVENYQADPQNRGYDVWLTIDRNIQYFAQEEIKKAVRETQAKEGIAMVMNPGTGEILAMAISSYFNPNNRSSINKGRWRNICISNAYEPGSTIKPLVLGAAVEEAKVGSKTRYYCGKGFITIYGKTIKDVHQHGTLSVRDIIAKSSNVGAIKIGMTLDKDDFRKWLLDFGFGRETDVGLDGESKGLLRNVSEWSGLSQPSMSIGQEIGVTPIQLITAYAAIANDGIINRPRVVQGIYKDGEVVKMFPSQALRRVISSRTAQLLRDILRSAVEDGTGIAASIPGYTTAGKTGTAQKYDSAAGSYTTGKYISSFVGFVPAEDPALVILVLLDEPVGPYYGGSVAAPVFARIGARALNYLAVPPDRESEGFPIAKRSERMADAG